MTVLKKRILPLSFLVALLICGGCGAFLDSSRYAYTPSEKLNDDIKPLPVTVAINYLDDMRGKENYEYYPLALIPLVPYGNSHFDRPDKAQKFKKKGLNPREDFSNALLQEMKLNNLFSDVYLSQNNDLRKPDLIVTGKVTKTSIDTKITLYGMSILGYATWIVGFPEGKLYNELNVQYEMRRVADNALVWKCDVTGEWNRIFAFYYNYSRDEPYTGINEILRAGLHGCISKLAEDSKYKPLEYWKP